MGRALDQDDGIGIYCLYLLREMLTLDTQSKYLIWLQTEKSKDLFKGYSNAEVIVMPAPTKLIWDQVTVPLAARKANVDLIFNPKFSIPLFTGRPCVFVQQGSDWYANPGNYPWWDNIYIRTMLPLYSMKATRTLSISQATLDDLKQYTSIDVSDSVVSYAGIGSRFVFEQNPDEVAQFRQEYKLPERYIFTVARTFHIGHNKFPPYPGGNNERLVRAYRRYRANGGTLPLVVAGHRVQLYLKARGFSDADLEGIQFLGFVPNVKIHIAFQLAECFILATLCESFGIPIVEAMATGCPVIIPTTCASPEIAGGAGRLINPLDEEDIARGLAEVTGSAELRQQMREKGLKRAQFFTWRRSAEITNRVLREVIERQATGNRASAKSG
jgi:glycosyltransferase involved in cell wall biosynthesis